MKKLFIILAVILTVPLDSAFAEKTKYLSERNRDNAFSFEYLGRTNNWSINFDHLIADNFGLGAGLYFSSASSGGTSATVMILPVYGSFYFATATEHRPFASAGLDIVTGSVSSGSLSGTGSGAAVVLGGGYEYRGDTGLLFRVAVFVISAGGGLTIAPGLSAGYAF